MTAARDRAGARRGAPVLAVLAVTAASLAAPAARAETRTAAAPAPAPAPARAKEPAPDPAVVEAGEANLESVALRRGLIVTLGFGGAVYLGLGMKDSTGTGGAGTLRLAHVANERSTIAIEIVGGALFSGVAGTLYRTDLQNLLVSGQYYLNAALWLRIGAGVGRYAGEDLIRGEVKPRERFRLVGPSGSVGAGVDVVRFKRLRVTLEFSSTALLNRDGVLSANGFIAGLGID